MNETITTETPPLTPREVELTNSIERQNETICSLKQALTAAEKENKRLHDDIQDLEHKCHDFTTLETAQLTDLTDLTDLEATMLQAMRDMAEDEFQRDEIGTALIGYDYLLKRLEVATI